MDFPNISRIIVHEKNRKAAKKTQDLSPFPGLPVCCLWWQSILVDAFVATSKFASK